MLSYQKFFDMELKGFQLVSTILLVFVCSAYGAPNSASKGNHPVRDFNQASYPVPQAPYPMYPSPPQPQSRYPPQPQYPHPPQPQYPHPPQPQYPHPPQPVYPPQPQYPPPPPPVYPTYHVPCDGCEIASKEFGHQLTDMDKLKQIMTGIKDSLACPTPVNPTKLVPAFGTEVEAGEYSISQCAPGRYVYSCRCINENEECAGVEISAHRDKCIAKPSSNQFKVRAMALCGVNFDKEFFIAGPSYDPHHPTTICPDDTTPVDCWLDSDSETRHTGNVVFSHNKCAVRDCAGGNCKLWALCKKTIGPN